MWELDHKWGWALKNRFFWTAVPEKSLESPLDYKEIKPVYPKGNQLWIFIGRTVAEVEAQAPILWLPDVKSQLTGKRPWCWERLRAWGEGGDRGWDGWMALLIQRTWTWANSGRWWGTRKPGMLQSIVSERVGHDLVTQQRHITTQMMTESVIKNRLTEIKPGPDACIWWISLAFLKRLISTLSNFSNWRGENMP